MQPLCMDMGLWAYIYLGAEPSSQPGSRIVAGLGDEPLTPLARSRALLTSRTHGRGPLL